MTKKKLSVHAESPLYELYWLDCRDSIRVELGGEHFDETRTP